MIKNSKPLFFSAMVFSLLLIFSSISISMASEFSEIKNNTGLLNEQDYPIFRDHYSWITELDMTNDGLSIFDDFEQDIFEFNFNSLKVRIQGELDDQDMVNLELDNENLLIHKFDTELDIEKIDNNGIIRTYSDERIDIDHILTRTSVDKPELKQAILLKNLKERTQSYTVSFIIETNSEYFEWNNEFLHFYSGMNNINIEPLPATISILDGEFLSHGKFCWLDLIEEGYTPLITGYHQNGYSVIECNVNITVPAKDSVYLDPSYLLENLDNVKLYNEEEYSNMGSALASGDFNNDGFTDLIFAAPEAQSGPADTRFRAGEVYIVFGQPKKEFKKYMNFTYSEDVTIYGASTENSLIDAVVITGDINNDNYDDIVIGAPTAKDDRGLVYVIFGRENFNSKMDLISSSDYDMQITGPSMGAGAGTGLAIGDVNGDSFGDIIISAPYADFYNGTDEFGQPFYREDCGIIYVLFGNNTMNDTVKLWDETSYDMRILGEDFDYHIGISLTAGDLNGDGFDDMIIGSPDKDVRYGADRSRAGQIDVIFGRATFPKLWDLLNYGNFSALIQWIPNTNFSILGRESNDNMGASLHTANLNNDGYEDLLIGVPESKGKNNAKTNAGEIYVIYGDSNDNLINKSLPLFDARNISRDGLVIYGKDSGDELGTDISTGDIDGDGILDFILGAPGGRGVSDDSDRTGEVYVFSGSSVRIYGALEIELLLGTQGLSVFYGNRKSEQTGYQLAAGDIDNNGRADIVIAAPYADSKNGSSLAVGRIDIIFEFNITPRIAHIDFKLVDGGGENGKICYPSNKHTFRVRVFNSLKIENLNFTQLSIAPSDLNIRFKWFSRNNTFYEDLSSDKRDYAELITSACVARKINETLYELDFVVKFNFTYPDHRISSCQVYSLGYNLSVPAAINQYKDIFYIENELVFTGNLEVRGSSQGLLQPGDRVHSGEMITWSGLIVVFNGTTDVYPADDDFDVSVWDDSGNFWVDKFSSGNEIIIESEADPMDDAKDIHSINITNIANYGFSNELITFTLEIVATKIEFSEPTPTAATWHNSKSVECSITIQDLADWKINGDSIEYSISTDGPVAKNFGDWQNADISGLFDKTTPKVTTIFENGNNNYIRWRAKSEASEIYSGSEMYRVLVDIEAVQYMDPAPIPAVWQFENTVECKLTIYDNLSGIDPSTLEYRYSKSGIENYGSWMNDDLDYKTKSLSVNPVLNITAYRCSVKIEFDDGEDNYIQWRALDKVGNSGTESDNYQVKVTTNTPITTLITPENSGKLKSLPGQFSWSGRDPMDRQLKYDVYLSSNRNSVETLDTSVKIGNLISNQNLNFSNLYNGETYYWTVIPNNGLVNGQCQSGIWSFSVRLTVPVSHMLVPTNGAVVTDTKVGLFWGTDYSGIEELSYDLYLGQTNPPDEIITENILDNKIITQELEDGKTYYWYVVPKVQTMNGLVTGQHKPEIMEFSINKNYIDFPTVNHISPMHRSYVTTLQPVMEWTLSLDDVLPEDINFELYLYPKSIRPQKFESNILIRNYTIPDEKKLEYNQTYYWRVLPFIELSNKRYEGSFSNVWHFTTVKNTPVFEIEFRLDKNKIKVNPEENYNIDFTVTNLGSGNDSIRFDLTWISEAQGIELIINPPSIKSIGSGNSSTGKLEISIPKNIDEGKYKVTLFAKSNESTKYGMDIFDETTLEIEVEEPVNLDIYGFWFATFIVVLILILLIFYIFVARSRSKDKEKPPGSGKEKSVLDRKTSKSKPKRKNRSQMKKNRSTSVISKKGSPPIKIKSTKRKYK